MLVETPEAMRRLGVELGAMLRPGDLVVLDGPLGAGKTTLTQGIAEGMQVRGPITSPTFVIARTHPSLVGGPALMHVDAYRIDRWDELDDLGFAFEASDIVIVAEWAAGRMDDITDNRLVVHIQRDEDDVRHVHIERHGARWEGVDVPARD